jgi:CubicO group peptidase (beta-lactamase class C family)
MFIFSGMYRAAGIAVLILIAGCHKEARIESPATSQEMTNYRAAAEYSNARNGFAVLVQKDGRIEFEDYHLELGFIPLLNQGSPDNPHRLASGTKSFWGVAAAAAVMDGLFTFDEKVSDTITEWKADPRKNRITVRQLLSLTSGIDAGTRADIPSYSEAIHKEALHEPGAFFQYGAVPFQTFGELLRRKLAPKHESPLDYLTRRILDPIGLNVAIWKTDKEKNPHMPSGAFLTAREWSKFGQFILNKGEWNGKTIVDKDILAECFKGSGTNPSYGLTFWLNNSGIIVRSNKTWTPIPYKPILPDSIPDLIMALGHGKQRLYIIPSKSMVIVRFGESENLFWQDREFLTLILGLDRKR